jgi:hypothetical protein
MPFELNNEIIKNFFNYLSLYSTLENKEQQGLSNENLKNYLASLIHEQASDLSYAASLSLLTKNIVQIVTDKTDEGAKVREGLEEEEVVAALQGLGVLINHETRGGDKDQKVLEEAFADLVKVQEQLKLKRLAKKEESKQAEPLPKLKRTTSSRLPNFFKIRSSTPSSKKSEKKITNGQEESGSIALKFIRKVFRNFQIKGNEESVRKLFTDTELRRTVPFTLIQKGEKNLTIQLPEINLKDIPRASFIRLNGRLLSSALLKLHKNKEQGISLVTLSLLKTLAEGVTEDKNKQDILIKDVLKALTQDSFALSEEARNLKNIFNQFILLITQATVADSFIKLQTSEKVTELNQVLPSINLTGQGLFFDIIMDKKNITLQAFTFVLFENEEQIVDSHASLAGCIACRREISFRKEDLAQDLLEQKTILKSLNLSETYSKVFPTKEEAMESLGTTIVKHLKLHDKSIKLS